MNVLRLGFENFRNLCPGEIFPGETINVIHGSNAQGKTNLDVYKRQVLQCVEILNDLKLYILVRARNARNLRNEFRSLRNGVLCKMCIRDRSFSCASSRRPEISA